jgi:hypothetical protein
MGFSAKHPRVLVVSGCHQCKSDSNAHHQKKSVVFDRFGARRPGTRSGAAAAPSSEAPFTG